MGIRQSYRRLWIYKLESVRELINKLIFWSLIVPFAIFLILLMFLFISFWSVAHIGKYYFFKTQANTKASSFFHFKFYLGAPTLGRIAAVKLSCASVRVKKQGSQKSRPPVPQVVALPARPVHP